MIATPHGTRSNTHTRRLDWSCEICGFPIEDDRGSITIPYFAIQAYGVGGHWHVLHYACQSEDGYTIDVSTCRTVANVLRWDGHLMGKNWTEATDWSELVARVTDHA